MACVKFKPNFGLKSYFFYFAQSLFKTTSIQFSISNSILFKYYFFINFLLLFSTQMKPNRDTQKKKKKKHQLHQQSPATSAKKTQQIYKLSQQ
jgi:phosphotransferase system  glucose/maltose/N-acetylglucosamine-specific IIC component